MVYIKILSSDNTIASVEAIEDPGYVRIQTKNQMLVRCSEPQAQGILSADGSNVYQLQGREALDGEHKTAVIIPMVEYEELSSEYIDPEDTTPVIPEETPESEVLTRAQLTEKVSSLEEQLRAAKILLGVD